MNRTVSGIIGGITGFFVGGYLVRLGVGLVIGLAAPGGNTTVGVEVSILIYVLAFVIGGIPGAAIGATVLRKLLRDRVGSMRESVGGVVGMLAGGWCTYQMSVLLVSAVWYFTNDSDWAGNGLIFFLCPAAALIGAISGAVVGAKLASRKRPDNKR